MSDVGTGGSKLKANLDKMDRNPFFIFSKPYLNFIGEGKIFGFVYFILAAVNLVIPFAVIYMTIDSGIFRYLGAKYIFAIILSWLIIAFASWIGFQVWWNRRTRIMNSSSTEFIATTSFSEIFQTFGEWLGTMFGIIGAGVGLISLIFLGNEANSLFGFIGLDFMSFGPMVIFIGPIIGFFIIIVFRFLAEQLRLYATLVNNTKDIAENLKNNANGTE